MNLYLITADTKGYDVYSDAVVAAKTSQEARETHPSEFITDSNWDKDEWAISVWARSIDVTVTHIGIALPGTSAGVICSSFHAG